MENMVWMDSNNKPKYFYSIQDILEEFYNMRIEFYVKRKEHTIAELEKEINKLKLKANFVLDVVEKRIKIRNRPKADLRTDMEAKGYPLKFAEEVNVLNLTQEKVADLLKQRDNKIEFLSAYKDIGAKDIWHSELLEFEKEYITRHGNDGAEGIAGPETHELYNITLKNVSTKKKSAAKTKDVKGKGKAKAVIESDSESDQESDTTHDVW